jgi:hypothetical protein
MPNDQMPNPIGNTMSIKPWGQLHASTNFNTCAGTGHSRDVEF